AEGSVRGDPVALAPQGGHDRLELAAGPRVGEGGAEALEARRVRLVEPRARPHALRGEGDVAPAHAGRDVGLVGRAVARVADVAVDARDLRRAQAGLQLRGQRLHGRAAGALVDVLVGEEPL